MHSKQFQLCGGFELNFPVSEVREKRRKTVGDAATEPRTMLDMYG